MLVLVLVLEGERRMKGIGGMGVCVQELQC